MLKRAMDEFLVRDCSSMRAVEPVKQHPQKMWRLEGERIISHYLNLARKPGPPPFTLPTQILSKVYIQNASLEIIHTKTIEEYGNVCGQSIIPFFTEGYEGFDLNTPDDWILAEELVKRGLVNLPEMNG
jgi:N-acylneuraminate cytidylyltransferase